MCEVKVPKLRNFEKEVVRYEEKGIETGKILFYGDSNFTRWSERYGNREMEEDIRMKDGSPAVINHGLGGSTSEELLYYYDRMVRPWKPRALVFSCSGNDRGKGYTPNEIMFIQSRIFEYARYDMPGIKIYLCNIAPTVKGMNAGGDVVYFRNEYNRLVEEYCKKHDDVTLVDRRMYPLFYTNPSDVGDYSKVRTELFIEDGVHFTQEGYDLCGEFYREVLKELL